MAYHATGAERTPGRDHARELAMARMRAEAAEAKASGIVQRK